MQAQVYKIHSDFYYVKNSKHEEFTCKIRDVLKKQKIEIKVGAIIHMKKRNGLLCIFNCVNSANVFQQTVGGWLDSHTKSVDAAAFIDSDFLLWYRAWIHFNCNLHRVSQGKIFFATGQYSLNIFCRNTRRCSTSNEYCVKTKHFTHFASML